MDQLESMRVFAAVAREGGFSAAGRSLGMPLPTVSRKVAELEEQLGAKLLLRSTRNVTLTDSGKTYFAACRRILDDLRDADEEVSGEYRSPKGELAITAPVGFGRQHLQPVVHDFLAAYPDIDVNLVMVDRIVDLLEDKIDCAVRIGQLPDSALVAKPLGTIQMMVVGSPQYLAKAGVPAHPRELTQHQCISWTSLGPFRAWEFRPSAGRAPKTVEMAPINVRLATTSPDSAILAAVAGVGLLQATSYQVEQHLRAGELIPVLREFETAAIPVSLVYPSQRILSLKLRAFLDFSTPRLSARLADITSFIER
ncbi:MAG: LysR family transcriptional regulator [Betaproteobacteria bacterium]|nr:LysR family transcriptional regulator [Betaproteobacteria bacterium]